MGPSYQGVAFASSHVVRSGREVSDRSVLVPGADRSRSSDAHQRACGQRHLLPAELGMAEMGGRGRDGWPCNED